MTAATHFESLHFLDQSNGPRFAIVTHPTDAPTGTGVLLCNGGWYPGSWNFNRMYVKLARSLAADGHRVVRFDWYGSGESPGYLDRYRLSKPFVEDVVAAAALLEGSQNIVGAGICFGAASLLSAADRIDHLRGLVLISASVPGSGPRARATQLTVGKAARSAIRPSVAIGWFDPYARRLYLKWLRLRWRALSKRLRHTQMISDQGTMAMQIQGLTKRGKLVWFLYGEGDAGLPAFSIEPLASASRSDTVRIEVVPFDVEGSGTIGAQEATSRVITEMVEAVTRARP